MNNVINKIAQLSFLDELEKMSGVPMQNAAEVELFARNIIRGLMDSVKETRLKNPNDLFLEHVAPEAEQNNIIISSLLVGLTKKNFQDAEVPYRIINLSQGLV